MVFEKRPNSKDSSKNSLLNRKKLSAKNFSDSSGSDREALIKSATSLIDDTRLNIKMRNLRRKMQEQKLKIRARKRRENEEIKSRTQKLEKPNLPLPFEAAKKNENSSKVALPAIAGAIKPKPVTQLPDFFKNKQPKMVNHNHDKFCQKYRVWVDSGLVQGVAQNISDLDPSLNPLSESHQPARRTRHYPANQRLQTPFTQTNFSAPATHFPPASQKRSLLSTGNQIYPQTTPQHHHQPDSPAQPQTQKAQKTKMQYLQQKDQPRDGVHLSL